MQRAVSLILLVVVTTAPSAVRGQGAAGIDEKLAFDVASVKPTKSGPADVGNLTFDVVSIKANNTRSGYHQIGWSGTRWTMTNLATKLLIEDAYYGRSGELIGAPAWVTSEFFDIDARAGFDPTPDQEQIMLRQLLKDRFKLAAHFETRDKLEFARGAVEVLVIDHIERPAEN
jgi:hypothetical protein